MADPINYIAFNQEFIKVVDFNPGIDNRAMRYGDQLFETLKANGTEPLFFEGHYERMMRGVEILQFELPGFFSASFLQAQIKGLLTRNKLFQAARVRISLIRKTGGLYIPTDNICDVLIETSFAGLGHYELNTKGLTIGIYQDIAKPITPLGSIKTNNALIYVLAGIYAQKNKFDDALLINPKGHLVESTSSNLFAIDGKTVHTPSISSGCVAGTMRKKMIDLIKSTGFAVDEQAELLPEDLLNMEEVFLTNAMAGIKWIGAYENRRYYKKKSQLFINQLNQFAGF